MYRLDEPPNIGMFGVGIHSSEFNSLGHVCSFAFIFDVLQLVYLAHFQKFCRIERICVIIIDENT